MKEITAKFIHGAIEGLIDARFRNEYGDIVSLTTECDKCPHAENCENHDCDPAEFRIENEISTMLDVMGVENEVESMKCFENPSTDIYAICVVFMAEGTFHTHNFVIGW